MHPGRISSLSNPMDYSRVSSEFTDGTTVGTWNRKESAPPEPVKVCLSAQQFIFLLLIDPLGSHQNLLPHSAHVCSPSSPSLPLCCSSAVPWVGCSVRIEKLHALGEESQNQSH